MSNFNEVALVLEAAQSNPKGDPKNIGPNLKNVFDQSISIFSEFIILMNHFGLKPEVADQLRSVIIGFVGTSPSIEAVKNVELMRDALCDINVFAYGAHHKMGIDADDDMRIFIDRIGSKLPLHAGLKEIYGTSVLAQKVSNFQRVSAMNVAFGNPKGEQPVQWGSVRSQCINIMDEFIELMSAMLSGSNALERLKTARLMLNDGAFEEADDVNHFAVRDALCRIKFHAYASHYRLGFNADRDMASVVDAVMTRFIKDEADKEATIALHAAKGVTQVYFEGEYPVMVMKSAVDQPDAPKGKFMKSASFSQPVFYQP